MVMLSTEILDNFLINVFWKLLFSISNFLDSVMVIILVWCFHVHYLHLLGHLFQFLSKVGGVVAQGIQRK